VRVGLFITCLADTFHPRTGAAVVAVLRHFGCEIRFPIEQTCCGQPAFNNGLRREAAPLVDRLARLFEPDEHVVCPGASCAAMIVEHGPELFAADTPERRRAEALAAKTRDVLSFMTDVLEVDPNQWLDGLDDVRLGYHYPCHSRDFIQPVDALARANRLLGGRVDALDRYDQCCGFGGMFAVEHAPISGVMVADKVQCIRAAECDVVVCDESGCRLNIEGALHRQGASMRVAHTAELIAEALGLPLPEVS
jgi:L-lactate dehydrogenase complex protein LldE